MVVSPMLRTMETAQAFIDGAGLKVGNGRDEGTVRVILEPNLRETFRVPKDMPLTHENLGLPPSKWAGSKAFVKNHPPDGKFPLIEKAVWSTDKHGKSNKLFGKNTHRMQHLIQHGIQMTASAT